MGLNYVQSNKRIINTKSVQKVESHPDGKNVIGKILFYELF